jgi:hypothetical protein
LIGPIRRLFRVICPIKPFNLLPNSKRKSLGKMFNNLYMISSEQHVTSLVVRQNRLSALGLNEGVLEPLS